MRFNNAIIGIVLLSFALAILWQVSKFPSLPLNNIGPATFPTVLAWGLILASTFLVIDGIKNWKSEAILKLDKWTPYAIRWRRMLLIPFVVIVFIIFSNPVGFVPTTVGLLFLMLYDYTNGSLLSSLAISIAFTAITYSVFVYILLVPLPPGILINFIR